MKTVTVNEIIKELSKYPSDMEVYYATKYALAPLEVKILDDRCIAIDMHKEVKNKYKEG